MQDDIEQLKKDMREVMRNHLPHIQSTLSRHGIQLKIILGLLTAIATAIIIDFLV